MKKDVNKYKAELNKKYMWSIQSNWNTLYTNIYEWKY